MKRTKRYLGFAFANADLLLEVDRDGTLAFAAGASQALIGVPDSDLIGRSFHDFVTPADQALLRRIFNTLGGNGRAAPRMIRLLRPDGVAVPCTLSAYRLQDSPLVNVTVSQWAGNGPSPAVGATDPDTHLLASNSFVQAAMAGLEPGTAAGAGPAITLLQMNNLHEVRANLTQEEDRQLMAEIGAVLRQHSGPEAVAGRLSDSRFGVMTPVDLGDLIIRDIVQLAQDLGLDRAIDVDARTLGSCGPDLSRADRARLMLYALRRFAEDGIKAVDSLSSSSIVAAYARDAMGRLSQLRSDLTGNRISLAYEPIVALASGRMHHLEVLCRFNGERPGPTISFAEEVGIINDIDMAVCGMAMKELESAASDISLAVNLSAVSIASDLFIQALTAQLAARPRLSGRLLFEITESGRLEDLPRARNVLNDLRRRGHGVCLDDFGAGMASFTYIRALDFDYVKLDGSYISRMCGDRREEAIVIGMLALCRSLNVPTIAEHVETAEQLLRLRGLGCTYGQGWFFAKELSKPKRRDVDLSALNRPSRWTPTVQDFGK
ncbi:MAG: EAL domain-containing protein [Azospirillaceae bacterium]|nr:EAL domain-containing protein [Azospirillaceae bacterium]